MFNLLDGDKFPSAFRDSIDLVIVGQRLRVDEAALEAGSGPLEGMSMSAFALTERVWSGGRRRLTFRSVHTLRSTLMSTEVPLHS